ncbi:MAG: S41 family peptidase [Faecousia sp.]
MENPRYDRQLRAMLTILENDYAGLALNREPVDSRYYIQAAGMAWKEGKLDNLTFLRFGSQMLATTMDRSLRLQLTAENYAPWRPGFDVRRIGDVLYVTDVQEETRLQPGDRILRLNALSPGLHRKQFQKNFLYAREPEREMWGNVLKMTKHVLVEHADGRREDLELRRFTGPRPIRGPSLMETAPGVLCLRVGDLGEENALSQMVSRNRAALDRAKRLIIDLRFTHDGEESDFLPLVPYILGEKKTMSEAVGMQTVCTLYTEENCRRRAGILSAYAGNPEADALLADLERLRGAGWVEESFDLWEDVPEAIEPRGGETLLLTDTFCEGAAESFALLARKEGRGKLVGRATMGSLDYAGMISVLLSPEMQFTYPMSITRSARDGEGFLGKGIQPDINVPFTPEECTRDRIALAAREL